MLPSLHVWQCNPWCLIYVCILWMFMWFPWGYLSNNEIYYVPYISGSVGALFMFIYGKQLTPSKNADNASAFKIYMLFDAFGTFSAVTWGALLLNYNTYGTDSLGLMLPISFILGVKSYASISWMQEVMKVPNNERFYKVWPAADIIKPQEFKNVQTLNF